MSYARRIVAIHVLTLVAAFACCPNAALSAVSFTGDTTIGSQFIVGNNSLGTFRIDAGSIYTSTSGSVVLGSSSGGVGIATVTGAGSQWTLTNTNGIDVGLSGFGRLEILNGGLVGFSQTFGGGIDIGNNLGSQGIVIVDGAGSLLNSGALNVGQSFNSSGSALLQITNNAMVFSGQTAISTSGRIELNGGMLRAGQFSTNNGVIVGSGEVQFPSTSTITNSGRMEASGGTLRITGPSGSFFNNGVIAAEGAAIELNRSIKNNISGANAAEITLRNGIVRAGILATPTEPQLTNSAVLAAIGGTSDFYGRVTNTATGSIAVTNHSVLIFHDDVTADGGTITVFPGSSAIFLEDLTMNEGSQLLADLVGTNQDTGFGDVEVVGMAQLAGSVQATLASGYTPQAGDIFPLVSASSLTGSLGLGDMPALPAGLKWDLDAEANRVVLSVVPGLAGDYNGDGAVDSADYVVWRKTFNQTGPNLAADGNSNGRVDAADYDVWRSRLGNTLESGVGAVATVPEPASISLLFTGLALVARRGRKLQ